jgi:putative lipase involved disintegration of autophagic bodies
MKQDFILKFLLTNASTLISTYETYETSLDMLNGTFHVDYPTVETLAKISYDVYMHDQSKWFDVDLNITVNISESKDTVQAYVFSDSKQEHHIVAFKGTSIYFNSDDPATIANDKYNDNLYFSCCFYKESSIFNETCDQFTKSNECVQSCYHKTLQYDKNYLNIAKRILSKVPNVVNGNAMFTGHSLGGALATMMGITYNKQVVTFESPGEKHYIDSAGLNYTTEMEEKIYHFGHNADIIFTGKCQGSLSTCYMFGYNIETKCHIGNVCEYDAISNLGLSESILTHPIKYVLKNILPKWNGSLPECKKRTDCIDCSNWSYMSL